MGIEVDYGTDFRSHRSLLLVLVTVRTVGFMKGFGKGPYRHLWIYVDDIRVTQRVIKKVFVGETYLPLRFRVSPGY